MHTFNPNTRIESSKVNENFTELSTGEADTDANSLEIFRGEHFNDYAPEGLDITKTTLLEASISAGTAYVKDATRRYRVRVAAVVSREFTASKDTYIYLGSDGTYTYTEVNLGSDAPALPANSMPIGRVITNGTDITDIMSYVCRQPDHIARAEIRIGFATKLDCKYIPPEPTMLQVWVVSYADGGDLNSNIRFNNDTTASYASNYQFAYGSSPTSNLSATSWPLESGSTDDGGTSTCRFNVSNIQDKDKLFDFLTLSQDAASATTKPSLLHGHGKYDSSDLINSITLGSAFLGAGSYIVVRDGS